ncbi:MAG: hypothetical protein KA793_09235 [Bacteroidales bacterium]|nr:hypothetical protein [Bacteroidales bacterium]
MPEAVKNIETKNCPYCGSVEVIKKGIRKNKLQAVQVYFCNDCSKKFTDGRFKNKSYSNLQIIKALSQYNLGHTLAEVSKKQGIPASTLANWLIEYRELFNLMKQAPKVRKYAQQAPLIEYYKYHHLIVYFYRQHSYKIENTVKIDMPGLFDYFAKVKAGKINKNLFTNNLTRASNLKLNIYKNLKIRCVQNNACSFAAMALELVNSNRKRHNMVESIMLENDNATLAIELPVSLNLRQSTIPWLKNLKSESGWLTGHIDVLQYRNGKLYILDFKPEAEKEKPIGQLFAYACCLSKATGVSFKQMKLAWFDEKVYYEVDTMDVYINVMSIFKK